MLTNRAHFDITTPLYISIRHGVVRGPCVCLKFGNKLQNMSNTSDVWHKNYLSLEVSASVQSYIVHALQKLTLFLQNDCLLTCWLHLIYVEPQKLMINKYTQKENGKQIHSNQRIIFCVTAWFFNYVIEAMEELMLPSISLSDSFSG